MGKLILFYPSFTGEGQEKPLYTDIPMSVVAIAQALHNMIDLEIIDQRIENEPIDFEQHLKDVVAVGISATTSYQIINGLNFAKEVRKRNPGIKIIWGGWHASLMPEETMKHSLVDLVILGQGEFVWKRLIHCLLHGGDYDQIPNIMYKKDGEIIKTNQIKFTELQIPQSMRDGYRYIQMDRYIHSAWGHERVLGYESSRGCPNACSFCSISAIYQRRWYGLPAENVFLDLSYLKAKYQINAVHFFDNNFFMNKNRALDFATLMKKSNLNIAWDGTVVVRQFLNFTQAELDHFKSAGCFRVIVGVESGDPYVLSKINKKHTNEEVLNLVRRCKENNLRPSMSFMVGFPWNPIEDTKNTLHLIEQIKTIDADAEILLFVFSPYLGTPLYSVAQEYGMQFPKTLDGWSKFTYDKPNTPWVSDRLKRKIDRYLEFFGTKEMSESEQNFFTGLNQNS